MYMQIGIYRIESPTGKQYVGQSINILKRFETYRKERCKTQTKLYNSFRKYGVNSHKFYVLEYCTIEDLNNKEQYWQKMYKCVEEGLNCRLQSSESRTGYLSPSTKLKISTSMKGRKKTLDHINKIAKAKTGVPINVGVNNPTKRLEVRGKISKSKTGVPNGKAKKVYQLNSEGEVVNIFISVTDALCKTGITGINNVVTGRAKTAGGYKWTYKNIYNAH